MDTTYKRVKVLINPSAVRDADTAAQRITEGLGRHGISPETAIPAPADEMAAMAGGCARERYDLLIGVGGDGTINVALNALATSHTALAVIPLGTANALARQLGMPGNLDQACEAIAKGRRERVDLGRVNGRYFGCTSGAGFDAEVIKQADPRIKHVSGYAAYLFSGLRNLLRGRFPTVRIRLDGDGEELRGYMVLVNNGKYYGGDFVFAPDARMNDGLLDVIVFQRRDAGSVLRYAASLKSGTIAKHEGIIYRQAKRITVSRHGRHALHADGEYVGRTPAEFVVVEAALDIVLGPGGQV